jgi:hypothetical protein
MQGSALHPAKKLFEKSFLGLQKLKKIGVSDHRHGADAPYNKTTPSPH